MDKGLGGVQQVAFGGNPLNTLFSSKNNPIATPRVILNLASILLAKEINTLTIYLTASTEIETDVKEFLQTALANYKAQAIVIDNLLTQG